jgi:hypothetical protein
MSIKIITAKDKAINLLNSNMALTYNCKTISSNCGMNCGIGVCKAQIIDAKRISISQCNEIIKETVFNGYEFKKIKSLVGDEDWYSNRIKFWTDVKIEIENI